MATDNDVHRHLDAIESHVRAARGDDIEATPWEFSIPTAQELRTMREQCGLSPEDFAELSGYETSTVENYERGRTPPGRQYIMTAIRIYRMEWPRHGD